MEVVLIVLVFFSWAFIQVTLSIFGFGKPKNLPPGPTPLPIIGNLHLLGNQPHRSLAKLTHIHGPVMLLKLGQSNTLVVSSTAAAKQVLQKQDLEFANRHVPDALQIHSYPENGFVFQPVGTRWRFLRRLFNTNMFSSKSLEASKHLRNQKVKELIAYCHKASMSNDYVDIGSAAFRTTLNMLANTIFSKDITNPNEDSSKEFRKVIGDIMEEAGKPNLVDFFPVLKKIDPQGIRRRMNRLLVKVLSMLDELIEERLVMGRSEQVDVLDVFLKISRENPQELSRSGIKIVMLDLFTAGTDTTSNTIEWAMTELLRNPHVLAKSKEELKQVIGKGKVIKEEDVLRLPYLSCIVKETLRLHPTVPLLLPRKVVNEVELNGYIIPKGTRVLVNAWAIGRDPTIWEDSEEFKPERFLTSHIDVQGQDFELIPFGAGRRICPGLPLALRTVPVMLGSLLNNFDWNVDMNIQHKQLDMTMTERFGVSLQKAIPLCVTPIPLN